LCHFDTSRCESSGSEVPLLDAAAKLIYGEAAKDFRLMPGMPCVLRTA
jgi:hypothetical protein